MAALMFPVVSKLLDEGIQVYSPILLIIIFTILSCLGVLNVPRIY